jgi:transmembrane sensor
MKPGQERLQYLFKKYYEKTATSDEKAEFFSLINELKDHKELLEVITNSGNELVSKEQVLDKPKAEQILLRVLNNRENAKIVSINSNKQWWRFAAAASVILLFVTLYFLQSSNPVTDKDSTAAATKKVDFDPGFDGAVLTLANGEKIILDTSTNGTLATQGNAAIKKKNGQLVYDVEGSEAELMYNTLSTPNGRQYQLVLADGSKVWLNAASSITYPTAFIGNERKISITGEAYLEVARNTSKPFKVAIQSPAGDAAEIEVVGTQFNINSYKDESSTKTTLIEGKVKIHSGKATIVLDPGQQTQISTGGKLRTLGTVDIEEVTAWKNGYFNFNGADLSAVMRQLARWYDVEVVYEGEMPQREFGGKIGRDLKLSQVLTIMERYHIRYKMEPGKLILSPKP